MDYTIRDATPADFDVIVDMAAAMHPETTFASLQFSRGRLTSTLESMHEANQGLFVAEVNGHVVGGMIAYIARPFFSMDLVAYEHALYIAPDYRKGRMAMALVEHFVAWAKAHGAKQIRPATSTGDVGRGAALLYRAAKFVPVGETFAMSCEEAA